jgi:hypothetical protein
MPTLAVAEHSFARFEVDRMNEGLWMAMEKS